MTQENSSAETAGASRWTPGLVDVYHLVLKLIGIGFLVFAIWHWYKIIGFADESVRFDTMPNHWRVASVALAVIQPVVAIGLWAAFSWGLAVWTIAALLEVAMYGFYSELFGQNDMVLWFHVACAVVLAVFQITIRYRARNEQLSHPFNTD